ncbi:MAG: hypothetical protein ACRDVF_17715 [Microbacterium sp.]|uniref:hypothetical protein n=1 Tax=Microbacterium sp. TaxID=51671 RepID=UPI003D6FEAF5
MADRTLNPFTWTDALPRADAVSREPFTEQVALTLKAGTHTSLFGPRGTGKTSFLLELKEEVSREHGKDAPPWSMIMIDLRRAISLPAFIGAVSDALRTHPDRALRRKASTALRDVEKEFGINLGVVKAGVKSGRRRGDDVNEDVILHAQLAALPKLADRIAIAFDEFQRLYHCPGDPLSQIRSALMGPENARHVSLMLTGSLREKLKLMLKTDTEPIWDQAHDMDLPDLPFAEFVDYLQLRFEASGRPISDHAVEHLVELGGNHPKRTQQLAWNIWERASADETIDDELVDISYEALLSSEEQVAQIVDSLLAGDEAEVNQARVLFMLGGGESLGSRIRAKKYGLADESAALRAAERLKKRGIIAGSGTGYHVVDPLLAEWLRRSDPVWLGL